MTLYSFLRQPGVAGLSLRLARDLARALKRGHPWVFAEALRQRPPAPPGTPAALYGGQASRPLARGFYDPEGRLAFRACDNRGGAPLDDAWAWRRCQAAREWRRRLFDADTTGFRLTHGEGDGLPGLVVDVYGDTAVLKLDGPAAEGYWRAEGVAQWVADALGARRVVSRSRERGATPEVLVGDAPAAPAAFLEHGARFTADVLRGQKTGFFLDQRDNRRLVRGLARGLRVLNMFAYTGGFSVAAGLGGAAHVTSVDTAAPALALADAHWRLNGLPAAGHAARAVDAFDFLDQAAADKQTWELVILDPPSFAPSAQAAPQAAAAYQRLIAAGARVTSPGGLLAAASCSSHVDLPAFLEICQQACGAARRQAFVQTITGQPPDHPAPLMLPEFRYLKFVLMRLLDGD